MAGSERLPHTRNPCPIFPSDTFKDFWLNMKFYQKRLTWKHKLISQTAQWTSVRKGTKKRSWICEPHDYICCWQNWNSLSICVLAPWALSVHAHWAKPYLTPSKSCSGFCFLVYWETTSDPTDTHTHICRTKFQAPIWKVFRAISLAATVKT